MKERVFKGRLNGVDYNSVEEFNKALKNLNQDAIHEISYSFEEKETTEKPVETTIKEVKQQEEYTFKPFTNNVFSDLFNEVFGSFAKVQEHVEKKTELPEVNPQEFVVKCNVDKLTGDDIQDDKMLDDYDRLLDRKFKRFYELSDTQKHQVYKTILPYRTKNRENLLATETKVRELNDYYEEQIAKLEKERELKENVLLNSKSAFELLENYYNNIEDDVI